MIGYSKYATDTWVNQGAYLYFQNIGGHLESYYWGASKGMFFCKFSKFKYTYNLYIIQNEVINIVQNSSTCYPTD